VQTSISNIFVVLDILYTHYFVAQNCFRCLEGKINSVLAGCVFNLRKMMKQMKLEPFIYCLEFAVLQILQVRLGINVELIMSC